ncbi:MAG: HEAT repeat domain-containing protein [Dechloromonas sp.]|nr:MAG: HEAT repeat domain-containing protein [Dechloromonas sp.]
MTATPSGGFADEWIRPLLELADRDPSPAVRLAALAAAAHFPLGRRAWQQMIAPGWPLVTALPAGSPLRRQALAFAAGVPLRTVRDELRRMADDPDEADRDAIVAALEEAGDPSRLPALLARAENGDPELWRRLALAPLEETPLTPRDVMRHADGLDPDATFWLGLAVGRLGNFAVLEDALSPAAPLPTLFWGSPWTAYERIATLRPIPDRLRAALEHLLARLGGPETPLDHDHARALRLTVWAATGSANAEGSPLPPPRPFGPVVAPEPFRSDKPVARLLHEQLATARPTHDDGQIAWMIAGTPTADLIGEVVLLIRQAPEPAQLRLLDILAQSADVQAGCAPTPFRGVLAGGGTAPPLRHALIDDRTRSSARPPGPPVPPPPPASRPRGFGFEMPDVDIASASRSAPGSAPHVTLSEDRTRSTPLPSSPPPGRARSATIDTAPVAFPTTGRGAAPPAAAETDERHVRATILHEGKRRDTFVAGAANVIRCWIGLPEDDGAASSDAAIPTVPIPQKGLELTVELCWGDRRDSTTLLLPASRSARSGDCDLRLDVPADERYVSAEIMFRYRGRSFEVVRVEAAALAPGEAAGPRDALRIRTQLSRREVIAVDDAQPCNSTLVFGDGADPGDPPAANGKPSLRVFDGSGGRNYALKSPGKAIEALNTVLFSTEKSLVRRLAASPGKEEALDAGDEEVRILLRDMARFGAGLFNQLDQQGFADPGDRIQLLSLDPDVVLPLEFVHDRGYPVDAAHLCSGWQGALEANATVCPACGAAPLTADARRHAQTVCPLGFWSLRKVIERLNPDGAASTSAPMANRRSLPAIDSAVFASSNKVPEDERNATWEAIRARIASATLARHWDEWHDAVKRHPRLLIALPHHDEEPLEDFLEIGDESLGRDLARLGRGQIRPDYVNPDGREPGPILLLLGCRTGAESELGYVQLVREFQKLKTAIVLGTLAQILGRHAAPLARELVTQLLDVNDPDADFGTLMRRVRRRMLARGYLLALCLVALGDAEWRLTPPPRPATGTPSP